MDELFVNNNGEILSIVQPAIYAGSRAFLYGDGLFESIRIINGIPIHLESHFQRLTKGADALKIRIPAYFTLEFMKEKINELLAKNEIKSGGHCRFSIDRSNSSGYLPAANELSYFIEIQELRENYFVLNSKGIEIDIYRSIKKQKNFLANFKTKNALIYIMATLDAKERKLDDYIIINELDEVVEATSSNLFIVSNGVLYTTELKDGCVAGTMRKLIMEIAEKDKIRVYECSITPQNLLTADEILLTNAIKGINWVGGYRTKTYTNAMASRLVNLLNAHWKEKIEK